MMLLYKERAIYFNQKCNWTAELFPAFKGLKHYCSVKLGVLHFTVRTPLKEEGEAGLEHKGKETLL